ncbi:hypothetical protein QUF76_06550 [Desulfobacterales bacterium HSG16]|nr:hypothetical protein [Desulfobacterales bacterium HSG16]
MKDQALDIDGHMALMDEARKIIHTENQLPDDPMGRTQVDHDESKSRILEFLKQALPENGGSLQQIDEKRFAVSKNGTDAPVSCTLDRETAQEDDSLELMGIDHPIMSGSIQRWKKTSPDTLGATAEMNLTCPAILTVWLVQSFGTGSDAGSHVIPIAVNTSGKRVPSIEKQYRACFAASPGQPVLEPENRSRLLRDHVEPTLQRELRHRSIASPEKGYSTDLLAWVEID